MPKFTVRLCYSGYVVHHNVEAKDGDEAILRAAFTMIAHNIPPEKHVEGLERWPEADMVEEVESAPSIPV